MNMTLGDMVRFIRKQKGFSVYELSKRTGINPIQIRLYEGGFREPRFFNLKKLATGLGIKVRNFEVCEEK